MFKSIGYPAFNKKYSAEKKISGKKDSGHEEKYLKKVKNFSNQSSIFRKFEIIIKNYSIKSIRLST